MKFYIISGASLTNKLLKNNLDAIKKYCLECDVEKLYAFGSITTDNFTESSDLDMLVQFKDIPSEQYADNYFKLHQLFEELFRRKIDLITDKSLSNPYFIKKLNQTKVILYEG